MKWPKFIKQANQANPNKAEPTMAVQTGQKKNSLLAAGNDLMAFSGNKNKLYDDMRESVPIIDAAINKIIRLVGGFNVECENEEANRELQRFCRNVKVGACAQGINQFMYTYLNDLLTYGNAVGEMIPFSDGDGLGALYNASLDNISIRQKDNPLLLDMFVYSNGFSPLPVPHQERILFSALNPHAGEIKGRSILEGLEFVTGTLLRIYASTRENFERMGNLRYAVTYKPENGIDQEYAREIAQNMAAQWAQTMDGDSTKDFVAVGDVDIKVIGADSQVMDSQVPARQMLEQIVAKLGLPPFILGLNWSSTERMSKQQADILTSELESYRNLLTPVICRICSEHLRAKGFGGEITVVWNSISITDEVEQARAQLLRAQAEQIKPKLN